MLVGAVLIAIGNLLLWSQLPILAMRLSLMARGMTSLPRARDRIGASIAGYDVE
jgi:hypothetical protein